MIDTEGNASCLCGRVYTPDRWRWQPLAYHEGGVEFRRCDCGSTISGPMLASAEVAAIADAERRGDWAAQVAGLSGVARRALARLLK